MTEELRRLRESARQRELPTLVGASEPMRRVADLIGRIARTKTAVLVTGESGTGCASSGWTGAPCIGSSGASAKAVHPQRSGSINPPSASTGTGLTAKSSKPASAAFARRLLPEAVNDRAFVLFVERARFVGHLGSLENGVRGDGCEPSRR
jgi:hypothetical protein